jgi:hypothetical protein
MNQPLIWTFAGVVSLTGVGCEVPRPLPPPRPPIEQGQLATPADVKLLAKAGVSEEVIISQIRNSRIVYHLTTAEILDLKENGVSPKVIDFMINTPSLYPPPPPPPPRY